MNNLETKDNQKINMRVESTIIDTRRGKFSPGQSIRIVSYCLTHFEHVEIETRVPGDIKPDKVPSFFKNLLNTGRHLPDCYQRVEYITPLGPKQDPEISPPPRIPRKRIRREDPLRLV